MTEIALQLIAENKRTRDVSLDLNNCGLKTIPPELLDCLWLEDLDFSNQSWGIQERKYISRSNRDQPNRLLSIAGINRLQNLRRLNLTYDYYDFNEQRTTIEDFYPIAELKGLKYLTLNNNLIKDLKFTETLIELERLDINYNLISNISPLSNLKNLVYLHFSHNKVSDISPLLYLNRLIELDISSNEISNIDSLSDLNKLRTLFANSNSINNITPLSSLIELEILFLSFNNIQNIEVLENHNKLKILYLHYNEIAEIKKIGTLDKLQELQLGNNRIYNVQPLHTLTGLQRLELNNNKISDIQSLASLKSLQFLDVSGNNITNLPLRLLENLNLEISFEESLEATGNKIFVNGNPISNPPQDVLEQGREFILAYFRNQDKRPLNECKVIMVGRGAVGKTSLQKRLFGLEPFDYKETETHGIRKRTWEEGVKDAKNKLIKVHFWDFGGQHIQQTLHQFFYTDNTVYLLVLDKRKDENPEDFLELIRVYGNNSPVIVAYNNHINPKRQKNISYNVDADLDSSLLNKYPNIRKVFGVCCGLNNDEGLNKLRKYLQDFIPTVDHVREEYPSSWLSIKGDLLRHVEKNYILYEEYRILCDQHKVPEMELQKGLAKMLSSVGTITLFDKQFLGNYYILNPDWVTTGTYEIILSDRTKQKKGRINETDLAYIFSKKFSFKYTQTDYQFLLNLMKEFDLCHEFSKNEWLIPSSLEGQSKTNLVNFLQGDYRRYSLKYSISLPESVIHCFIARNIKYSHDEDYWKNGIVVKHPDSETLMFVEADRKDKEIRLWIKGLRFRDCWEYFRKDFKDFSDKFFYNELVSLDETGEHQVTYKKLMNLLSRPDIDLENWYDPELNIEINVLETLSLFENIHNNKVYKENLEEMKKLNERHPIIINIPINNNTGQQIVGNNNATSESKDEKTENSTNKFVEDNRVIGWKHSAIYLLLISLILTGIILLCYFKEYKFIASKDGWNSLKNSDLVKWGGAFITILWNGLVLKMVYDRYLDPSKEKAFRDSLKGRGK